MEWLSLTFEQTPILTLFLVIALGYALGKINLRGFSLGVGAVLFVERAVRDFSPKSAPPGLLGTPIGWCRSHSFTWRGITPSAAWQASSRRGSPARPDRSAFRESR